MIVWSIDMCYYNNYLPFNDLSSFIFIILYSIAFLVIHLSFDYFVNTMIKIWAKPKKEDIQ